jgi:demethylmenaquinone methyltransferase / 2-methoxy-6-polyprenyl-1,4-benzoquinol methylase
MSVERAAVSARTRGAERLFEGLPATYERVGSLLSFGQDPRWRGYLVSRVRMPAGGRVLDVATGTAAVARELLRRNPSTTAVCLDQSEPMLREGIRRTRATADAARSAFVLGRGQGLPFPDDAFDAVTFTYLLRYVDDPAATVAELARVLRPGGSMASLEFHVPNPPWHVAWWTYCRAVMPLAGRAVSPAWHDVASFLGPSIAEFVAHHPLSDQLAWWRRAGIRDARARTMTFGSAVVIWGTKHGA